MAFFIVFSLKQNKIRGILSSLQTIAMGYGSNFFWFLIINKLKRFGIATDEAGIRKEKLRKIDTGSGTAPCPDLDSCLSSMLTWNLW
ncbi:hypothetical protein ACQSNA_000857 [Vibrio metschnikovii]|jgi:hypothetical protein|uniref:Uncharacterized protein n=1 Tax=Vibrio metschnikovii TaxID=28172 RepID=A0A9X0RAK4_VIBME|nr:hypothetical protein [Vibrio metschnikovii]